MTPPIITIQTHPDPVYDALVVGPANATDYGGIVPPQSFEDVGQAIIHTTPRLMDAAVRGVPAAVREIQHGVGHILKIPLSDHPTNLLDMFAHAQSVGFDSRAGTQVFREHDGPPEVVAAAKNLIAAYASDVHVLTVVNPPTANGSSDTLQFVEAEIVADIPYAVKHFALPVALAGIGASLPLLEHGVAWNIAGAAFLSAAGGLALAKIHKAIGA